MEEERKSKFILYALVLLLIVDVVGYMFLLKADSIDALHMTVITISIVGFGETGMTSSWSEFFSIIMTLLGVGIAGYTFTMAVAMLVEGKVKDFRKGSKMEKRIAPLNDHYIIRGPGELAEVIINKFIDQNLNFVVITSKRKDLDDYSHHDILVVEGISAEEEALEYAGIDRVKGLVSTLDSEVGNIVTVLAARDLNENIYIIANATTKSGSEKLMKVGANKTLSAVEISGKRMAPSMTEPDIISSLDVVMRTGDVEPDLEEVVVKSGSCLKNKNLIETQIPNKTGLIVPATKTIEDNKMTFSPPVNHTFQIGDVLIAFGKEDQVDKLKHLGDETK